MASPTFDVRTDRYQGGAEPQIKTYHSPEANTQARLLRVARLLQTTPAEIIQKYGGTSGPREERIQQAVHEAEAVAGDEYVTSSMPYDSHIGGTGVHLARPLDLSALSSLGIKGQDTSSTLYALKRLKRQMQERIEDEKHAKEYEKGQNTSTRPVELVRSCKTAGPGWDYCDPLKEGECPPPEVLKGTPYENVFSAEVGVPPNNRAVRCVPADLIRIGGDKKRSEESLERRLHAAIQTIYAQSSNIAKLAQWRTQAPCDAIPDQALRAHPGTCDSMFFAEDGRTPQRCINAKMAESQLPEGSQEHDEAAELVKAERDQCFSNPGEYENTLKQELYRIKRLRQALRVAAESGMRVSDFVNRFNRIASENDDKYNYRSHQTQDAAGAAGGSSPFQWGHVSSYILDDSQGNIEDLHAIRRAAEYNCKDATREVRRHLAGGGSDNDDDGTATMNEADKERLARELAQLLSGGGGEESDPCTAKGTDCDKRLLRVLKILHRLVGAETKFRENYKKWHDSHQKLLDSVDKDVRCRQHKEDPNMCKNMLETCREQGYECDDKTPDDELDRTCKKIGTEYVNVDNINKTWTVDKFDEHGHPIGFRWLVDSELRNLRNTAEDAARRQCAAYSRTTVHDMERHRESFRDKQKSIIEQMEQHYPESVRKAYNLMQETAHERDRSGPPRGAPLTMDTLKTALREIMEESSSPSLGGVQAEQLKPREPTKKATVSLRFPNRLADIYTEIATQYSNSVNNDYSIQGIEPTPITNALQQLGAEPRLGGGGGDDDTEKKLKQMKNRIGTGAPFDEIEIDLDNIPTDNAHTLKMLSQYIIEKTLEQTPLTIENAKAVKDFLLKRVRVTVKNVTDFVRADTANSAYNQVQKQHIKRQLQADNKKRCKTDAFQSTAICSSAPDRDPVTTDPSVGKSGDRTALPSSTPPSAFGDRALINDGASPGDSSTPPSATSSDRALINDGASPGDSDGESYVPPLGQMADGTRVPEKTVDTQHEPSGSPYKDYCPAQVPYLCGNDTNLYKATGQAYCRRTEGDCNYRNPGKTGSGNQAYTRDDDYYFDRNVRMAEQQGDAAGQDPVFSSDSADAGAPNPVFSSGSADS